MGRAQLPSALQPRATPHSRSSSRILPLVACCLCGVLARAKAPGDQAARLRRTAMAMLLSFFAAHVGRLLMPRLPASVRAGRPAPMTLATSTTSEPLGAVGGDAWI